MNENQFKEELAKYILMRREDVMFTETKIEGKSFSDYHIDRLKRENNGHWDDHKAVERINQLFSLGVTMPKKCQHCDNVFNMHAGDNFCGSC